MEYLFLKQAGLPALVGPYKAWTLNKAASPFRLPAQCCSWGWGSIQPSQVLEVSRTQCATQKLQKAINPLFSSRLWAVCYICVFLTNYVFLAPNYVHYVALTNYSGPWKKLTEQVPTLERVDLLTSSNILHHTAFNSRSRSNHLGLGVQRAYSWIQP